MKIEHDAGGFAYLPGLRFAYNGVIASPGMVIEHAVLREPLPLPTALDRIRRYLGEAGRPLEALCGLELRLPAVLPMAEFRDFNEHYLAHLDRYALLRDGASPLARTNVAPSANPPEEPVIAAFSYTVFRETSQPPGLVITGVAELGEDATFPDGVVRRGETSVDALVHKASFVCEEISTRIKTLGATWEAADRTQLYCAHPAVFEISRKALGQSGVHPVMGFVWHDSTPPVLGLELEIDVQRYQRELIVEN